MTFFMAEIDSAPSKTSRSPKIMKFDILDLQKSLPYFFKIWQNFHNF